MPRLIRDGAVVEDDWILLSAEAETSDAPPAGNAIIPLDSWLALYDAKEDKNKRGVCVPGDADLDPIGAKIVRAPVIAVHFAAFMDGRGFSVGRLLRERFHFGGELRAVGHIIRDQLCYLRRCGFNAFQLAEDADLDSAIASLDDFQEYYQAAVDEPLPLFRRRRA